MQIRHCYFENIINMKRLPEMVPGKSLMGPGKSSRKKIPGKGLMGPEKGYRKGFPENVPWKRTDGKGIRLFESINNIDQLFNALIKELIDYFKDKLYYLNK